MGLYTPSIPLPGVYGQQEAQARAAYDAAQAQINQQRDQALSQYGFKATSFDAQGNVTGYEVDSTNQNGAYQRMLGQEGAGLDATRQSFLSRGVRGGLANQAELMQRQQYGAQRTDFLNNWQNLTSDLAKSRLGAEQQYNAAVLSAEQGAAQDAIANRLFTTADTPNDTVPELPQVADTATEPANPQVNTANAIAYATSMLQRARAAGVYKGPITGDPRAQWRKISGTLTPVQRQKMKKVR